MVILPIFGAVACGTIALIALTNVLCSKTRRPYRQISMIALAVSTPLCLSLIVVSMVWGLQKGDELSAQERSSIQQVASELQRLEFQPPPGEAFDDPVLYRFTQDDFKKGTVIAANDKGRRVPLEFVIGESAVSIGCTVGDDFRPVTPYGAMLLRSTKGCDI